MVGVSPGTLFYLAAEDTKAPTSLILVCGALDSNSVMDGDAKSPWATEGMGQI